MSDPRFDSKTRQKPQRLSDDDRARIVEEEMLRRQVRSAPGSVTMTLRYITGVILLLCVLGLLVALVTGSEDGLSAFVGGVMLTGILFGLTYVRGVA